MRKSAKNASRGIVAVHKEAKLTSKGQVTVPREVRRILGVRPGDRLMFEDLKMENGETGIRVRPVRSESAFSKYRGIGNPGIGSGREAIAEWLKELRGE
jgi:AbrB family looped-hinge helix DNA binding protein